MAYTRSWDETLPPDIQVAKLYASNLRDMRADIRERMASFGAGLLGDRPTPDSVFGAATFGVTFQSIDTGQTWRYNGSTWIDITPNVSVARYINVTPVALVNPTPNGNGQQLLIPSNSIQAGDVIKVVSGLYHSAGTGIDAVIAFRFGAAAFTSTVIASSSPVPAVPAALFFVAHGTATNANTVVWYSTIFQQNVGPILTQTSIGGLNFANPIFVSNSLTGGLTANTYTFEIIEAEIMRL